MAPKKRQAFQVGEKSKRAKKSVPSPQQFPPEKPVLWVVEDWCGFPGRRKACIEVDAPTGPLCLQYHIPGFAGSEEGGNDPVKSLLHDISSHLAAPEEKAGP